MANDVRVVINPEAMHQLLHSPAGPVGKELERRALKVEGAAKRHAPVDTGRLRASITHRLEVDALGLMAVVGTNVAYAIYQEFGTRSQHGTPYLRPALFEGTR